MTRLELRADIPDFRIRLRGYDRAEVEEYLHRIRLGKVVAREYGTAALGDRDQTRASRVLEDAQRDAGNIRAKAEAQARRTLDEADREAVAIRARAEDYGRRVHEEAGSRTEAVTATISAETEAPSRQDTRALLSEADSEERHTPAFEGWSLGWVSGAAAGGLAVGALLVVLVLSASADFMSA